MKISYPDAFAIYQKVRGNSKDFWTEADLAGSNRDPEATLMVLSDWGTEKDGIDAVEHLRAVYAGCALAEDQTTRVLSQAGWRAAIVGGRVLIMNAIWSLRQGSRRSGNLPAARYNEGFTRWYPVAKHLLEVEGLNKIVIAGSWGKWDDMGYETPIDAAQYFRMWLRSTMSTQANLKPGINRTVLLTKHPQQWSDSDSARILGLV